MPRRESLSKWMRRHLRPADGPDAGKPLRLERWQSLLLDAIDREGKPIVACRMASQVGKSMLAVGVGLRAALDGRGCLMASATDTSIRDLARRLQAAVDSSPDIGRAFPQPTSGPGSRGLSWKNRTTDTGGWLGLAAAGSASQLASRTAAVAVADEIARWPARVKFSTEGSPLALLRARLFDWGDEGRLLAISSPVLRFDAIDTLFRDGDRRRLEYRASAATGRRSAGTRSGAASGARRRRSPVRSVAHSTMSAPGDGCFGAPGGLRSARTRPMRM